MNPLAPELNSQCNLQNRSLNYKILFFYAHTDKKGKSKRKKIPAGPYMNDHNWPMHMLRHLGTETPHPAKQRTCRLVLED
jgi:hypothetical protein